MLYLQINRAGRVLLRGEDIAGHLVIFQVHLLTGMFCSEILYEQYCIA
jgi:hypothetical protein